MIVTLISPRSLAAVRAALPGRGGRFTFRGPSRLVEATGQMRADGEGTRLVADGRLPPAVAFPVSVVLGLLVLVSFSVPAVFAVLLAVVLVLAVASPRLLARYRADRTAVLAALVDTVGATQLPPRERGRPH